eukprot:365072-Chlamydomonas_euryale.AAC.12
MPSCSHATCTHAAQTASLRDEGGGTIGLRRLGQWQIHHSMRALCTHPLPMCGAPFFGAAAGAGAGPGAGVDTCTGVGTGAGACAGTGAGACRTPPTGASFGMPASGRGGSPVAPPPLGRSDSCAGCAAAGVPPASKGATPPPPPLLPPPLRCSSATSSGTLSPALTPSCWASWSRPLRALSSPSPELPISGSKTCARLLGCVSLSAQTPAQG